MVSKTDHDELGKSSISPGNPATSVVGSSQKAVVVNPKVKTFLALMNNRLVFAIPHGWQDAMYNSYMTRVGKPADLLKQETDPVVIDGLRQAIASYEKK